MCGGSVLYWSASKSHLLILLIMKLQFHYGPGPSWRGCVCVCGIVEPALDTELTEATRLMAAAALILKSVNVWTHQQVLQCALNMKMLAFQWDLNEFSYYYLVKK